MRILLVRPPRVKQAITIGEFMFCEPIGLEGLVSVLKNDHCVRILDMMIDHVDIVDECADWEPDVVGLTSLCLDVKNVLAIAGQIKAHDSGIVTLVGGTQTFFDSAAFHDEAVDHVMQYTTVSNLLQLVGHLEKKDAVPAIDGVESRSLGFVSTGVKGRNEYIVPDMASTAHYRKHYSYFGYRPCAIMQTSQGCGKQCRFCLRWRIEGGREDAQDMAVVFDQVMQITEPNIMIFDNDFLCDGDRLNKLCALLEENGVKKNFICYGSVHSVLKNRDAVARFGKNGLAAVVIGYESFSPVELKQYHKKSTPDDNLEAARILQQAKVDAWACFIMHPDWNDSDFTKFRRYIRQLRPEIASMTALTPFPGLPLYKEFADRLIIRRDDFEKWDFGTVSIMPSRMSLRRYYLQIMLTNLYVGIVTTSMPYLVRKFGFATLFRLLVGSMRLMNKYIVLMLRSGEVDVVRKRPA